MDKTLQHYLDTTLPYRLHALHAFEVALHLVAEFPSGAELECVFNGKPKIKGRSTAITNPTIEMGIIHSRVLLDFLGLKATSKTQLVTAKKRMPTDICIESFDLDKITIKQVLASCNGNQVVAESAIAITLSAANKLVAHSTDIIKIDNNSIDSHLITCKAIPVLFNLYFYQKLGLPMPNYGA
jgi:hypothetical protein